MELIDTSHFRLATYSHGNPDSPRMALILPGRLDTKDYIHNTSLVDYLGSQGYLALAFDPPGTWDSPGSIGLYTTTNYLQAVDELITYFGHKPTVLIGHSRGGTIAMLSANHPHVTNIVSIFSYYGAPSSPNKERIIDNKVISRRDLPPGNTPTQEQKQFTLPLNYFADGQQYNALPILQNSPKPKLFFYGTKDTATQASDVQYAFKQSLEPKQIQDIDCEHDYRYYPEAITQINQTISKFLKNPNFPTHSFLFS